MEKTTVGRLDPSLREELEALLAKQPTLEFESDFQDMLVWKLLLLLVSTFGLGAFIWDVATESVPVSEQFSWLLEYPLGLVMSPRYLGALTALVVAPWMVVLIAQNVGRCGFAALSTTLMVIRGRRVKVLKYADIADVSTRKMRTKKQSWTALDLKLKDGRSVSLDVHGAWVAEVMKRLGRA
jgi:hypothetical protein